MYKLKKVLKNKTETNKNRAALQATAVNPQIHSIPCKKQQRKAIDIKKCNYSNKIIKNKNCPYSSVRKSIQKQTEILNKALALAKKHDLPESFVKVLVDVISKYQGGKSD